ncbi:MAG: hypothetical protein IJ711_11720 [Lachnospiraceae bacterium]|nr:hypothetical protein [Lachnospiraceae bacterium]
MTSENTNQNEQATNKKSKLKDLNETQRKKLRSAVLMAFASILMLSGATFAWFTIGNTVRVKSLSLQVAAEGKLYIADTSAGLSAKQTELDLKMGDSKILYPASTKDGKTFLKPVYESDTVVKDVKDLGADDKKEEYYYEKELWLIVDEQVTGLSERMYDITLARKGEGGEENLGSYVNAAAGASSHPEYCIRISFETEDGKVTIYEPNSDGTLGGSQGTDYAENKAAFFDNSMTSAGIYVHRQSTNGNFTAETGNTYYDNDSSALFSMKPNTPTKVMMRVWFEGTDKECQNAIEAEKIIGQIKFVSHNQADASANK